MQEGYRLLILFHRLGSFTVLLDGIWSLNVWRSLAYASLKHKPQVLNQTWYLSRDKTLIEAVRVYLQEVDGRRQNYVLKASRSTWTTIYSDLEENILSYLFALHRTTSWITWFNTRHTQCYLKLGESEYITGTWMGRLSSCNCGWSESDAVANPASYLVICGLFCKSKAWKGKCSLEL